MNSKVPATILLDQATPGMVLAADVCQSDGSVLLPAGIALSETQIAGLRKRGYTEIVVAPAAKVRTPEEDAAIRTNVRHLFRKSETDAVTQAFFKAVLEYRLEKDA